MLTLWGPLESHFKKKQFLKIEFTQKNENLYFYTVVEKPKYCIQEFPATFNFFTVKEKDYIFFWQINFIYFFKKRKKSFFIFWGSLISILLLVFSANLPLPLPDAPGTEFGQFSKKKCVKKFIYIFEVAGFDFAVGFFPPTHPNPSWVPPEPGFWQFLKFISYLVLFDGYPQLFFIIYGYSMIIYSYLWLKEY